MTDNEEKIKYQVLVNKKSREFLNKLDKLAYTNILSKMVSLEDESRPTGCIKLAIKDAYRIRWSVYRLLYTIDDDNKIISVYDIAHRKDVYKKKE
ncbi:MAG: Plasmid stabilization system protein [Ignavibacteria bacterium]|nr:Plasmid stabilization system protein [Ignavibacteria bacterium]